MLLPPKVRVEASMSDSSQRNFWNFDNTTLVHITYYIYN